MTSPQPASPRSHTGTISPFQSLLDTPSSLPKTTHHTPPVVPTTPPRSSSVLSGLLAVQQQQLTPPPPTRSTCSPLRSTPCPPCTPTLEERLPLTSTQPPSPTSGALASPHSAAASSSNGSTSNVAQQFCLRWNNYQSNLTSVFDHLLQTECFVDVTLACDGRSIKAHKIVLSACSPYFQTLFADLPCQHPIVIMRDVNWNELKAIVEFMYKGEINVSQDQIGPLLRIAEMLKVRGLADVNSSGGSGNVEEVAGGVGGSVEAELARDREREREPEVRHSKDQRSPRKLSSPRRRESYSPAVARSARHEQRKESEDVTESDELLAFMEPEKKLRLAHGDWDFGSGGSTHASVTGGSSSSNLELRLSPRNVRKRRWPSVDTHFNPPASPLSDLIAAERAEREREREREREQDRVRERAALTPPLPIITSVSGSAPGARLTPSVLEAAARIEIPSPSPTPAPNSMLLPPGRSSTGALTPSPQLSQSHHHHHQPSHQLPHHHPHALSHRTSPASAATSTHSSSVISGALTPSSVSGSGAGGGVGAGSGSGRLSEPSMESRFPLGHAQAAAMAAAAAAAQMELGPSVGLGHHHPVSTGHGGPPPPPPPAPHHGSSIVDDLEIKPGIAEMIREEERAKMLENSHAWMSSAAGSSIADSYQYQLQSMWQKCWNTNQNLMHHLRFRERGPLKSWRPETMAEAIFSVLKEGLSLSQAARKYDIPYPTFVLYANRVHNMLGPSIDGGPDLRPKGRGRPQRILLGIWPDEHIKGVIKTVVFRDAKEIKDDGMPHLPYGRHSPIFPFQDPTLNYPGLGMGGPGGGGGSVPCPNGVPTPTGDQMSQEATAAAVAAVAHNLRQQMQMAAAAQHQHSESAAGGPGGLFNLPPHLQGPGPGGMPLPKTSISPALSSGSNPAAPGVLLGPRHAPSPCGPPGLPGLPSLPPSMAVALHMAGGAGPRCDPAAILSQQQQHQLQQLHMQQQQHAAMHHQQHQPHHGHGYGAPGTLSHPAASAIPSVTATATATSAQQQHQHQQHQLQQLHHQQQQQQQQQHHPSSSSSSIATKSKSSSASPAIDRRRSSPIRENPLHSPLTELGLDMAYKSARSSYSPTRLFAEDIAELVGVIPPSSSSVSSVSSTTTTTTAITPAVTSAGGAVTTTSSISDTASGGGIKLEPITTSSE